jgi:uncharacterized protein YcbX
MLRDKQDRTPSGSEMPSISEIHIYPIKGLPTVRLEKAMLSAAQGLPDDRRYAITKGINDTLDGEWLQCRSFLINAVNDGLLKFSLAKNSDTLCLTTPDGDTLDLKIGDGESLDSANRLIGDLLSSLTPASPRPVLTERKQAQGAMSGYWDFTDSAVSLMNRASLEAVAKAAGKSLDIRRLRGNLIIDGLPAWEEFSWPGRRIAIGNAELEIIRPALRCPATSVNPESGERDIKVPDAMNTHFGHAFCGIYARVVKNGEIAPGATVGVIGNASLTLEEATGSIPAPPDYRLWPKMAEVISRKQHGNNTEITIRSSGPWQLPEAASGQRMRFHLGPDHIGIGHVLSHRDHTTVLHVSPSETGDPATAYLLEKTKTGDRLLVSGPFGRI